MFHVPIQLNPPPLFACLSSSSCLLLSPPTAFFCCFSSDKFKCVCLKDRGCLPNDNGVVVLVECRSFFFNTQLHLRDSDTLGVPSRGLRGTFTGEGGGVGMSTGQQKWPRRSVT